MRFAVALLVALASACSSSPANVRALVGRYELRSVNGRAVPVDALGGALGGDLVLTRDGRAIRVVRYARSGLPGPFVHRTPGTYRRQGTEITFRFLGDGQPASAPLWDVRGEARPPSILLRYRRPAGGTVEEHYVRVTP
jgi:hypothetical protein